MYPAQALGEGEYSYNDLPDAIEVFLENQFNPFTRNGNYYYSDNAIGLFSAGNYRLGIEDTGVPWVPGTEDWQYYWLIERFVGFWETIPNVDRFQCLIRGLPEDLERTHDNFADFYTLSWNAFGSGSISATVERESLCVWSGIDPCGVPIYLFYGDNEAIPQGGDALGWNVRINIYVGSCSSPDGGESIQKRNDPSALQNTPIGVYLASTTTNVTVS
jgi:hypothetical protein